jgi:tRNA nucleotidyltransferase/poly(A) polymerase
LVRPGFNHRTESKDIDVVCVGSGICKVQTLAESLGENVHVNVKYSKKFRTAQVRYEDIEPNLWVPVLNLTAANPANQSWKTELWNDQNRRDFTINALGISLNSKNYGELVDPFDGVKDIKRTICTPLEPELLFSDDPFRMMCAIRFVSQLNLDIASLIHLTPFRYKTH